MAMGSEQDGLLIRRCLDAYYASCPQLLPGVPAEMLAPDADLDEEWRKWRPIPSRFSPDEIVRLERKLPTKLPPLFKAYLTTYFILDMDFGEYHLLTLPSDNSLEQACWMLLQDDVWKAGYVQFASNPCGDPVCFDLADKTPDGDYAVVVINHDMVQPDHWEKRELVAKHTIKVANSFREFITKLCLDGKPETGTR